MLVFFSEKNLATLLRTTAAATATSARQQTVHQATQKRWSKIHRPPSSSFFLKKGGGRLSSETPETVWYVLRSNVDIQISGLQNVEKMTPYINII
jgi:hypothetical protein